MPAIFSAAEKPPVYPAPAAAGQVALAEVISALSFALDLVEDAKPGHAIRTCLLGMRIAASLRLKTGE